jgi:hypothetical protein
MKRLIFAISIGLSLAASAGKAHAQSDVLPTPKEPFIAAVPDYGHWIVTFKYPKAHSSAPAAAGIPSSGPAVPTPPSVSAATNAPPPPSVSDGSPLTIETIKTGDLRGVTLTFTDGSTSQFTCQGDWTMCSTPQGPQLRIASPTAVPYPYYTNDFIMLDGVKVDPSTFKEAGKHDGIMAFHYKSGDTDVWIDAKTALPLAAKQDGVQASYQFLTPPPRPFPIPKDQETLLHKAEGAYKATSSMR